jgi:hypothetical protein
MGHDAHGIVQRVVRHGYHQVRRHDLADEYRTLPSGQAGIVEVHTTLAAHAQDVPLGDDALDLTGLVGHDHGADLVPVHLGDRVVDCSVRGDGHDLSALVAKDVSQAHVGSPFGRPPRSPGCLDSRYIAGS